MRQKELAKAKLVKMSAYQKQIHELYMPKPSDKLRLEREQNQANLKTAVRDKRPFENYLGQVVKENAKKRTERVGPKSRDGAQRKLQGVASLPSLNVRELQSDQKLIKSPIQSKPDSSRNFRRVRHSTAVKAQTAVRSSPDVKLDGNEPNLDEKDYIDWQHSRKLTSMGNQNM